VTVDSNNNWFIINLYTRLYMLKGSRLLYIMHNLMNFKLVIAMVIVILLKLMVIM